MKAHEIILEGTSTPCIVVDVQPEYSGMNDGDENPVFPEIIQFVNNQTGPVLMFVNSEDQGLTGDSIVGIKEYWNDTVAEFNAQPINWNRFAIVDKGYGYFRPWMDAGINPAVIIRMIRTLYQNKVNDSRELFGGEGSSEYAEGMEQLVGPEFEHWMLSDPITVNWTSVAQLKKFSGAYIVGGGRNECLREVELLMNAFNIRYRRIDRLVYG
jgi:hypothetical protein